MAEQPPAQLAPTVGAVDYTQGAQRFGDCHEPPPSLDSTIRWPTGEESDVSDSLDQARDRRAGLRSTIDKVERALARPAHEPVQDWNRDLSEQLSLMSAALDQHIAVTEDKDGLL